MQPIERYGVIALLMLVVIIAAVVMWDQGEKALVPQLDAPKVAALDGLNRETVPKKPARKAPKNTKTQQPEFKATTWQPAKDVADERRQKDEAAKMLQDIQRAKEDLANEPAVDVPSKFAAKASEPNRLAGNLIEPQAKSKPVKKTNTKGRTYEVQSGDTMGQIAVDQLGSYRHLAELEKANPGVDPGRMTVGTKLVLPSVEGKPVAKAAVAEVSAPKASSGRSYKVGSGDSLWAIAARELGDGNRYNEIAALNPKINPNVLVVGTDLVLPKGTKAPAKVLSTSVNRATVAQASPKRGVVR